MKINKKRFTVFITVFSIIVLFSGIKFGEVLANKMLDKPNREKLKKVDIEEKRENEVAKQDKQTKDEGKEKEKVKSKEVHKEDKKESKKENNKENVKKEKNKEDKKENIKEETKPTKNEKVAYLTFDDGPSRNVTPQILDILRKYNIKATFFVTGRAAEKNMDIVRRAYSEGHSIGNHSYSHNYKYLYSNTNNFLADMKKNEELLKEILGPDFNTKLVRLPGGSYGEKKGAFRKAAKNKGYKSIDWNALTGDAEGHHIPKNRLMEKLKNTSQGKDEIIVLMHDLGTKQTTVSALPEVIEYLKKEGYEFRPLN